LRRVYAETLGPKEVSPLTIRSIPWSRSCCTSKLATKSSSSFGPMKIPRAANNALSATAPQLIRKFPKAAQSRSTISAILDSVRIPNAPAAKPLSCCIRLVRRARIRSNTRWTNPSWSSMLVADSVGCDGCDTVDTVSGLVGGVAPGTGAGDCVSGTGDGEVTEDPAAEGMALAPTIPCRR